MKVQNLPDKSNQGFSLIEVTSLPYIGTGIEWDNPKLRRRIHTYQTTVVKMGQDFVGE